MTDSPTPAPTPIGDAPLSSLDAEAGQVTPTPAEEAPTAPADAQAPAEPVAPAAVEGAVFPPTEGFTPEAVAAIHDELGIPAPASLVGPANPEPVAAQSVAGTLTTDSPHTIADLVTASSKAATLADQRELTPGNIGVATQVANPKRTAWRTFVQSAIGILIVAVPLANAVLANLSDYLQTQHDLAVAPWVFVAVNGGLAITAFVIGLVARLMATPGVAAFIETRLPFLAPIKTKGAHELV